MVILHTDVQVRPDDVVMEWSIGSLMTQKIAEYKNSNNMMYGDALDGRLRGRLTLRDTGSLTIKDTRTTDSGVYRLKITESIIPTIKRFRLTVTSEKLNNLIQFLQHLICSNRVKDYIRIYLSFRLTFLERI